MAWKCELNVSRTFCENVKRGSGDEEFLERDLKGTKQSL
jgi:hypothetical protein